MESEGHEVKKRTRRFFGARRRQDETPSEPQERPAAEQPSSDDGASRMGAGGVTSGKFIQERAGVPAKVRVAQGVDAPDAEAGAGVGAEAVGAGPPTERPPAASVSPAAKSERAKASPGEAATAPTTKGSTGPEEPDGRAAADSERAKPAPRKGRGASEPRGVIEASGEGGGGESRPLSLPTVLAIANQKGGVGKTTTAVNLGASLAELGFRVLVVDLDPQGNATTGLGINARDLQTSVYDVIMNDVAIEDCVEPTSLKNLFVAPATIDLAGAEIELVPAFSRELKLRRALEAVRELYEITLIDCPPSLGLLTVNALAACDAVIVPIQCEYYALEGLGQLLRNVALVRTNLNPTLDVQGIVLTMYDARTKLADQVEQEVRDHFGGKVYRTVVPRNVRIGEAPSYGQPVILYDSMSRGAIAYRELGKEVSRGATRRTG